MSKDTKGTGNVARIMTPVYPVVERSHARVLEDGGFLNKEGYVDILALIHSAAMIERKFQLKVQIGCVIVVVVAAAALKYFF